MPVQASGSSCGVNWPALASEQSPMSKSRNTVSESSKPESPTDALTTRQSGTTLPPSTGDRGADAWISSVAASRAKISHVRAKARDSKESAPGCSTKSSDCLAKYDPATSSWRTFQLSILGELTPFSGRFPKRGMTRGGRLYALPTLARRTGGSVGSAWPGCRATDADRGGRGDLIQAARGNTNNHFKAVKAQWLTPKRPSGGACHRNTPGGGLRKLEDQVANKRVQWPTPNQPNGGRAIPKDATLKLKNTLTAQDAANNAGPSQFKRNSLPLNTAVVAETASGPQATAPSNSTGNRQGWSWATPDTRNSQDGTTKRKEAKGNHAMSLHHQVSGQLNPDWVETLMGVPTAWTDCAHSVMGSSLSNWRSLSLNCLGYERA